MENKANPLVDSIEETPRLGRESPLRVSVVVTVKNDEAGIGRLMKALEGQTVKPEEVIIVESSNRETPWHTPRSHPIFVRRILSVGCSRGEGRNVGIRMARNEVIAVTDAGCFPHKDWLYKLHKCYKSYKSFKESPCHAARRLLIAGWYRVKARTELQRVMAHFLVPKQFYEETPRLSARSLLSAVLPASRSIMFTKAAWTVVGGYPEEAVSGGEDLEFARRLAAHPKVKMIYCPRALVDWEPPAALTDFFRDIVKHTRGNMEVGYRPHLIKNSTVVLRWIIFVIFPWMIPVYLGIKVIKIIKVINIINIAQIILVQLAADAGVIWGLISSLVHKFNEKREHGL